MRKESTSKLTIGISKVLLEIANFFSDYENTKSIPWWSYEVKVPEEIKYKK